MKLTYKVQLQIDDKQRQVLLSTLETYREIANIHAAWGYQNRTRSKVKAHHELYHDLRKRYPEYPSSLLQAARDVSLEALRGCKFKSQPNFSNCLTMRYNANTMTLRGEQLTLSTSEKRIRLILNLSEYHKEKFKNKKINAGNLVFKRDGSVWFYFSVPTEEDEAPDNEDVLGVDVGIIHTAVTSEGNFYSGREIRKHRRRYLYNRRTLQKKGTRSAKRRLKAMSGKEKRLVLSEIHTTTRNIVNDTDAQTIAVESLARFKSEKYLKKANKTRSDFPFYLFRMMLTYKAQLAGKNIVEVDPRYTSQRCSMCDHIYADNRKGSKFLCVQCGFATHADLNAAINIKQLSLVHANASRAGGRQPADDARQDPLARVSSQPRVVSS